MTFDEVSASEKHLLLKCVSGSKAYNLSLPTSDTDIKGIFVVPQDEIYGLSYTEQVSNPSHDEVYYEVGRFVELLLRNNPNIIELLNTPEDSVLYKHPLMDLIKSEDFLSKLCLETFAGYAKSQVRKASGLNKKINQHFEIEKKSVLEFCFVLEGIRTTPLLQWLRNLGASQDEFGLVKLDHFRDAYAMFRQDQMSYGPILKGILSGDNANDVQVSPVSKGLEPLAIMYFNKDSYSIYCKEYASYWTWVHERNESRFETTISHGKQYDAKNMMHTIRLLNMAHEIAESRRVNVHRSDRDFLLKIRSGYFEYSRLMEMVDQKMEEIFLAYSHSNLPGKPDDIFANALVIKIRNEFYSKIL